MTYCFVIVQLFISYSFFVLVTSKLTFGNDSVGQNASNRSLKQVQRRLRIASKHHALMSHLYFVII